MTSVSRRARIASRSLIGDRLQVGGEDRVPPPQTARVDHGADAMTADQEQSADGIQRGRPATRRRRLSDGCETGDCGTGVPNPMGERRRRVRSGIARVASPPTRLISILCPELAELHHAMLRRRRPGRPRRGRSSSGCRGRRCRARSPVSMARSSPAIVPAKASGNQASGQRGRCQAPGRRDGRVVERAGHALGPAGPADRAEGQARRSPRPASGCRCPAAAPSRAGPAQTSSQAEARAPSANSRMYRLMPSSWGNCRPRVGPGAGQDAGRVAEPVAEGVEVVDAHDERRRATGPPRPRASSAGWPASRSSPAPARPASPRSSSVLQRPDRLVVPHVLVDLEHDPRRLARLDERRGASAERHRQRLLRQDAPDPAAGGRGSGGSRPAARPAARRRRRPRPRGRRASPRPSRRRSGTPRSAATSAAVAAVREVIPTTRKPASA